MMIAKFLIGCFVWWFLLGLLALVLIRFRKDAETIEKDIVKVISAKFPIVMVGYFMMYFILPFTIPFSVAHIFRNYPDDSESSHR
jgi:hypothetical protein